MVSSNNKLFEVLEYIVDLILLNFLFIICSLPLITAYPAFVALVGTIKDRFEDKPILAWKQFFTLFYKYIKKGMKTWIVLWVLSIVIIGDIIIGLFYLPNEIKNFLLPFNLLLVVLFLGIFSNIIKLFILGEDRVKRLFITSFILLIREPRNPLLIIFITMLFTVLSIYLKFILFFSFSLIAFTVYLTMFKEKEVL